MCVSVIWYWGGGGFDGAGAEGVGMEGEAMEGEGIMDALSALLAARRDRTDTVDGSAAAGDASSDGEDEAATGALSLAIELGHRQVPCLLVERNHRVGHAPRAKTTCVMLSSRKTTCW